MRILLSIFLFSFLSACDKEPDAPLPIANFFVENAECPSPCYAHFNNQSYGAVKWSWDFDNSDTSIKEHDSSLFQMPGLYDVSLTVWNADNVSDEITKQIIIY